MLREYPAEIQKLMNIYKPYEDNIVDGELNDAPKEAADAFRKVKQWFWEQDQ